MKGRAALVDHLRTESIPRLSPTCNPARSVPLSSSTRPKTSSTGGWKKQGAYLKLAMVVISECQAAG